MAHKLPRTSGARSHNNGYLTDAFRRKSRLIVEDSPEMFSVGEDVRLPGQVGAAGIYQIDAGEMIFFCYFLSANMLLDRQRVVRATLDCCVIGHDDALDAANATNA